jgi:hypothetical protein
MRQASPAVQDSAVASARFLRLAIARSSSAMSASSPSIAAVVRQSTSLRYPRTLSACIATPLFDVSQLFNARSPPCLVGGVIYAAAMAMIVT